LRDTVKDVDSASEGGNGFTFDEYSAVAMLGALGRALAAFADRAAWRRIQQAGMREDFSWAASAQAYGTAYERAVAARSVGRRRFQEVADGIGQSQNVHRQ
jgi:starch synthase